MAETGSCESVRRASAAPSSLRLPPAAEGLRSRITTAALGRGGHRINQLLFPLPLACRWTAAGAAGRYGIGPYSKPGNPASVVPGQRVAKRNARKEEQIKSGRHPVHPPHRLCGSRVFRPPGSAAGSVGPPMLAAPIRPTPALRQISPEGGVFPPAVFFCQDKRKWVHSPWGVRSLLPGRR